MNEPISKRNPRKNATPSGLTEEHDIFLLFSRAGRGTQGVHAPHLDAPLTFAFTTKERGLEFINTLHGVGLMPEADSLLPTKVGEFFRWQREGKVVGGLAIDPNPHSIVSWFERSGPDRN